MLPRRQRLSEEDLVKQQCPLLATRRASPPPPQRASCAGARLMCFPHTQHKSHIEVQSPRTSKTVLINLLTATQCYIFHVLMLFNQSSHRCHNQGTPIRTSDLLIKPMREAAVGECSQRASSAGARSQRGKREG